MRMITILGLALAAIWGLAAIPVVLDVRALGMAIPETWSLSFSALGAVFLFLLALIGVGILWAVVRH